MQDLHFVHSLNGGLLRSFYCRVFIQCDKFCSRNKTHDPRSMVILTYNLSTRSFELAP